MASDLPNIRAKFADRHLAAVESSMSRALKAIYQQAITRIEAGQDPEALRTQAGDWAQQIFDLREDEFVTMVAQGYLLALQEFGSKRARRAYGKDLAPELDALKERLRLKGISEHLRRVSTIESETTIDHIEEIYQRKLAENLTARQMAREIQGLYLSDVANRASMIARTETIWAYNEGAMLTYQDAGFEYGEWLVTEDDLLCEFCEEMLDRNPITLGGTYARDGEDVDVGGAILHVGGDVTHPPLHPHCRCSIVPYTEGLT